VEFLFEGFKRNTQKLLTFGALALVLTWLIIGAGVVFFVVLSPVSLSELMQIFAASSKPDPEMLFGLLVPLLATTMILMLLFVPLYMAVWFAPTLIILDNVEVLEAMSLSFEACTRNWASLLVYSLVAILFWLFAILPLGLGLFVAYPVFMITAFMGYRDIFVTKAP
jgi:uncharacterized membrane protein